MLTSSTLRSGFRWIAHWLYLVSLLNAAPKRSGLVKHPDVPMHSLPTEPLQSLGDWSERGLRITTQARPVERDGSLTLYTPEWLKLVFYIAMLIL